MTSLGDFSHRDIAAQAIDSTPDVRPMSSSVPQLVRAREAKLAEFQRLTRERDAVMVEIIALRDAITKETK